MLPRFTFLMTLAVLLLTFASSKSEAQFPRNSGLNTPADRAIGDLAWPDVSQWQVVARGSGSHPLIAHVETKIASLLRTQEFEGRGCDLNERSLASFFPQVMGARAPMTMSRFANEMKSEYLFSVVAPSQTDRHSQTTFVRLNPDESLIREFIAARCDGTKTMGLQDACVVTSFCKAK